MNPVRLKVKGKFFVQSNDVSVCAYLIIVSIICSPCKNENNKIKKKGHFWTVENDEKMFGKRQLFSLDTALVLTP